MVCSLSLQTTLLRARDQHDWVEKVIHWILYKELKYPYAEEWHMHQVESVLENAMHKIHWNFEIQTDHWILARRVDLVSINKKRTCQLVDFAIPADCRVKMKETKKIDKYLDLAREL